MRAVSSVHLRAGMLLGLICVAGPARAAPSRESVALHEEGVRLSKGNLPREAVAFLEKAVKADPTYAEAWADLGGAQLALDTPTEAVPALEMAVALKPTLNVARYNLAFALRKLGSHAQAASQYRIYLQREPGDADAQFGLAEALRDAGDLAGAAEAYEAYATLEQRPEHAKWIAKAQALALELRERVAAEARARAEAIQKGISVMDGELVIDDEPTEAPPARRPPPIPDDPNDPRQSFQYGLHLLEIGKYANAMLFLRRAAAASPDAPLIIAALGAAHLGQKEAQEAELAYRRALRTAPAELQPNLWFGLGESLRLLGDQDGARAAFEKVGKLPASLPVVRRLAAERVASLR